MKKNKSKILKKNNFLGNSNFFQNEYRKRITINTTTNSSYSYAGNSIKHKIDELSKVTLKSLKSNKNGNGNVKGKNYGNQKLLGRLLFSPDIN